MDNREHKDTVINPNYLLQWEGKSLDLSTAKVMGILNVTPDSFYDGGKYDDGASMMDDVEEMIDEGVDIIDVGGISTRPGAKDVDEQEEFNRVIPVVEEIRRKFPKVLISVDTYRSGIARASVDIGADMINDVSAGAFDEKLIETVADLNVPYILMHMKGTPQNMQEGPVYEDVFTEILRFFKLTIGQLKERGVNQIIVDPGFGFGKSLEHNYMVLRKLDGFKVLNLPILVGISRKSMISKLLNIDAEDGLNGTSVLNGIALLNGASILRVHDVKEARETINLIEYYGATI